MPAGMPYFAWIDPEEDEFGPEHLRWDEQVFSFELAQDEGDPASLTVVVRRPRNVAGNPIGLLGPGRKIWCWFGFDCGPDLILFRGRLVGVPTSLFEELVTLEFVARPIDLVAQKEALAESLRVLPYYDEVVIDEARRADPEVVLEGYSAIWHYDRETHELTVSDEIDGEDGLVEFDGTSEDGKVLYDGLALTLTSGPLTRVDIVAEYTWTQQARGTVDTGKEIIKAWPGEGYSASGAITSFSFTAADWPKQGAGGGDGWEANEATASSLYDLSVQHYKKGAKQTVKWPESMGGGSQTQEWSEDVSFLKEVPPGSILLGGIVTADSFTLSYGKQFSAMVGADLPAVTGVTRNYARTDSILVMNHIRPTLKSAYTANRQCTEKVSLSLFADVQHILTDPEDGETLRIADVKSVNLSDPIGEGTGAEVPIEDPSRRSYIATPRGNRSLEYLIALARANLLKRARVVEIAFVPKLARMPEITLRKNAFLSEPRIGEALGKIIGYSLALDGSDGQIKCEVRIGCAIGRGGSAVAAGGEPTYCTVDYVGADYQQFTGRIVLFDTSVGYEPPISNPNDDGLELTSRLNGPDVVEEIIVENGPEEQRAQIMSTNDPWTNQAKVATEEAGRNAVASRAAAIINSIVPTRLIYRLKSMNGEFTSDYAIQITDLKIPTGYDLGAS